MFFFENIIRCLQSSGHMGVRRFHSVCLAGALRVAVLMWQGVVVFFRVVDGTVGKGDTVRLMNTGKEYTLDEVGVLAPKQIAVPLHSPLSPIPSIFPHFCGLNQPPHLIICGSPHL